MPYILCIIPHFSRTTITDDYEQSVFDEVASKHIFQKSAIAFLREILDHYGKENSLSK